MSKFLTILILLAITNKQLHAQDSIKTERREQLRNLLGMSLSDYANFDKQIMGYYLSLNKIFKDSAISRQEKTLKLAQAAEERKAFIKSHLTLDQLQRLEAFEKKQFEIRRDSTMRNTKRIIEEQLMLNGEKLLIADSVRKRKPDTHYTNGSK